MPPMGSSDPRFGRPEGPQIYGQPGGIGPFAPKIPRPNESAFHLLSSQGRHDRLVEAAISNWVPNNPNGDANENELEADNMIEWHYRMRDTIDLPLPPRHWSDKLHGLYTEITQQRVASMLAGAYAGNMTPQPINDSYVYNKPVHTRDMNTLEQEDMSDAYPDVASLNAESGSRSHVESYRPY